MSKSERKTIEARNFATVVYPESAPENWREILQELKTAVFISPLHDCDCNPDGEVKKAHYHVMLMYEGKKNINTIRELCATFGGVGCEKVESKRGYARYLCHLDNPEKAQYNPDDVTTYGGENYTVVIGTVLDKYKAIREMIAYCNDNGIISYSDLVEYCMVNRDDWFRVLADNGTYMVREYLKSKEWTMNRERSI